MYEERGYEDNRRVAERTESVRRKGQDGGGGMEEGRKIERDGVRKIEEVKDLYEEVQMET